MFNEEKLKEEREVKWKNCWKRHENATNPSISTLPLFTDKLHFLFVILKKKNM